MTFANWVLMGPCPGCDAWQLEFNPNEVTPDEIELIVAAHAQKECPGLMAALVSNVMLARPGRPPDVLVGMPFYEVVDPDA